MQRKWFGLIILALAAVFMITGCSESKPDTKENADDAVNDKKKDELVMAFGSEPEDGFDPTTGWGRYGSPLFQSTLLKRNDDLEVVNDLAESYEIDEDDNKIWTVKLRDDVTFSDGERLTAEDVVFTFETAAENGSVVDLNVIDEVEALDKTTVQFTLEEPRSTFVNTLIATGIVPEHAYGDDYAENPVGSGPYEFVQWDKGQQLIVRENPEYYGDKPNLKK